MFQTIHPHYSQLDLQHVGPRGRPAVDGAPERSYLVDDRQKAELLARLARRRSALRLPGILVIVVMFAAFGFAFWSFHHSDWARGALLFVSAIAAIVLFGEVIAPAVMRLAIRPVLARAGPTAIVRVPHDVSLANELSALPRAFARWFPGHGLPACLFFAGTAIGELTTDRWRVLDGRSCHSTPPADRCSGNA